MLTGALRKQWENVQDFPNLACQQVLRWAGMAFCHLQLISNSIWQVVRYNAGPYSWCHSDSQVTTWSRLHTRFSLLILLTQMSIYLFALRFSRRILQGGFFQVAANFKSSVSNSSIYTHWSLQGGCTPFCAQNRFNFSCHGFNFKILIHVGTFAADAAVWCMMPHDAAGSTMQIPFSTTSQSCSTAEAVWVQWIHCRVQETSSRWFCAVAKHSQEAVCVESGTHRALLAEVAVFIRNKPKSNKTSLCEIKENRRRRCVDVRCCWEFWLFQENILF